MEKEEFQFSPLRPILLVISSPAVYYFFSTVLNRISSFTLIGNIFEIAFAIPLLIIVWRELRITFLMLLQKPAIVLTDESITIVERRYTIKWTDMKDVYMANDGSSGGGITAPKNRYVILRVREPEKYIMSLKNPFTRYYRWCTRGFWSLSPFEVSLFLIKGDDDEIYHTILKYYQNNRGF
jgi:hypothetical protein